MQALLAIPAVVAILNFLVIAGVSVLGWKLVSGKKDDGALDFGLFSVTLSEVFLVLAGVALFLIVIKKSK